MEADREVTDFICRQLVRMGREQTLNTCLLKSIVGILGEPQHQPWPLPMHKACLAQCQLASNTGTPTK